MASGRLVNYCWRTLTVLAVLTMAVTSAGCERKQGADKEVKMALNVSSPAFQEGKEIPRRYSCEGEDVSPGLQWSDSPEGTKSFALIMDDPDAPGGTFTHWVLFNLPPDSRRLPEAVPAQAELPTGALQGKNDFGKTGYGGPCPPPGRPHRYQFTVYAIDRTLDLKAGISQKQLRDAMQGHILAQGRLTGIYQR